MQKNLLKLLDLSGEDIIKILDLGDKMKYEKKNGIPHETLKGKTLAMIFEKSSTRTRVSFEVGMFQLGGNALFLNKADSQMGRGESVYDTANVLSRYCDGIMIRTFGQDRVEEFAKHSTVPIINGLTDFSHPCQVLADLMTIRETFKKLDDLHLCYIGDGNNMANSLIVGGLKCGMKVSVACPKNYEPNKEVLEFAKAYGSKFVLTQDPFIAAKDADALVTDVWASMGQEDEMEQRIVAFKGFQINKEIMAVANPNAIVQHCLPAHRDEEISSSVFSDHADVIFEEAENRLHVQKAIMSLLMA